MNEDQVKVSVCQGEYERINGQLMRVGRAIVIEHPGRERKEYRNPTQASFVRLTGLFLQHCLEAYPWNTMVGYTTYWTPGIRAEEAT